LPGHVFALRTWSPPVGTNLTMMGHPLGNQLSITQGKIYGKGKQRRIPTLAVRLLGAQGASGAPLLDDDGKVAGVLQIGLGRPDFLGQNTSGFILGIDIASWWPRARLDLCRKYPTGGILGCPQKRSPAPNPRPTPSAAPACSLEEGAICDGDDLHGRDLS